MEINVKLNPEDIAKAFCDFNSDEQAEFFNNVYKIAKTWKNAFCFQACYISDSEILDSGGRNIMCDLHNGG